MKRVYIHTDQDGTATPYQTLTDLCAAHNLTLSTVRNALQKSNLYRNRYEVTVNDTWLRESEARKRPGNARNWAKKAE
jgi:hypothetical protein